MAQKRQRFATALRSVTIAKPAGPIEKARQGSTLVRAHLDKLRVETSDKSWHLDEARIRYLFETPGGGGATPVEPPAGLDRFRTLIRELEGAGADEVASLKELAGFEIVGVDDFFERAGFEALRIPGVEKLEGSRAGGGTRRDGLPENAPPSGFPSGSDGFAGKEGEGATVWRDAEGATHKYERHDLGRGASWSRSTTYNPDTGESTRDVYYVGGLDYDSSDEDSVAWSHQMWRKNPDASQHIQTRTEDRSGSVHLYEASWDSSGSLLRRRISQRASDGSIVRDVVWNRATGWVPGPSHVDDNPGPDGTTRSQQELAEWLWRQHQLGRHTPGGAGPRTGTHVNPGDPEYEGAGMSTVPTVWAYVDPGSLAVNPDPNSAGGGGAVPGAEAWQLMLEDLRRRAGGPDPGTPDDRGNR